MWSQANAHAMLLEPITEHGWRIHDNKPEVVQDSQQNLAAIRDKINYLRGVNVQQDARLDVVSVGRATLKCLVGCECTTCCNIDQEGLPTATNDISAIAIDEEITTIRPSEHDEEFEETQDEPVEEMDSDSSD